MKFGGWMVMIVGMLLFMSFLGLETSVSSYIGLFGYSVDIESETFNSDIEQSGFWKRLFSEEEFSIAGVPFSKGILLALVGTATIIIGLFAKGYDVSLALLPLVVFVLGYFVSSFVMIIKLVSDYHQWWMTSIVGIIFGTLLIGFIWSGIDYFGGR